MLPSHLNELLKQTSRSFYLTLRVLPRAVRSQIGLAYLLARTTDTIADTKLVPMAERRAALRQLRERILGTKSGAVNFGELARLQGSAERALLDHVEEILEMLSAGAAADAALIRAVLDTITSGQVLDLERFANATASPRGEATNIIALQNRAELNDYTYRVAGCVGEFWTKMCRAHLFPRAAINDTQLLADGVRFGQGLQLVNILRDLPADLRQGRCYIPLDQLAELWLTPEELLSPANEARLRPLYDSLLDLAHGHLAAGWRYTNSLPRGQVRVRLACAWPILIGAETLAQLRRAPVLEPQRHIKVSRGAVRWILLRSLVVYPFTAAWTRQFVGRGPEGKAVA